MRVNLTVEIWKAHLLVNFMVFIKDISCNFFSSLTIKILRPIQSLAILLAVISMFLYRNLCDIKAQPSSCLFHFKITIHWKNQTKFLVTIMKPVVKLHIGLAFKLLLQGSLNKMLIKCKDGKDKSQSKSQ